MVTCCAAPLCSALHVLITCFFVESRNTFATICYVRSRFDTTNLYHCIIKYNGPMCMSMSSAQLLDHSRQQWHPLGSILSIFYSSTNDSNVWTMRHSRVEFGVGACDACNNRRQQQYSAVECAQSRSSLPLLLLLFVGCTALYDTSCLFCGDRCRSAMPYRLTTVVPRTPYYLLSHNRKTISVQLFYSLLLQLPHIHMCVCIWRSSTKNNIAI